MAVSKGSGRKAVSLNPDWVGFLLLRVLATWPWASLSPSGSSSSPVPRGEHIILPHFPGSP